MKQFLELFNKTAIGNIIAVITVIGTFILLYLMIIKEVPPSNKDVLNTSVGFVFGGLLCGVSGYFFGASKNSNNNNTPTQ